MPVLFVQKIFASNIGFVTVEVRIELVAHIDEIKGVRVRNFRSKVKYWKSDICEFHVWLYRLLITSKYQIYYS